MAFSFDDLREKVTDLAQSGVAKSKQLAEIAKLKTSNMGRGGHHQEGVPGRVEGKEPKKVRCRSRKGTEKRGMWI